MNRWIATVEGHDGVLSDLQLMFSDMKIMRLGTCSVYFECDGRFMNDQIFSATEDEINVLDGVILNLQELEIEYKSSNVEGLVRELSKSSAGNFFTSFTGPFCGIRYIKSIGQTIAYCNQTGDAPLFYYQGKEILLVSNDLNLIIDVLRTLRIEYHLNENSALYVMTFGYMIDDGTFIEEIQRLGPGKYLEFTGDSFAVHTYYYPEMKEVVVSDDEAVELIDRAFRKAVQRCFDKDLEYGYTRHLADMSGGLDSRMVSWVAKEMGYKNVVNISYSQSGSDEYKDAALVSKELGNMFMHEQMDDAGFLLDVDKIVDMQYGSAVYYGITGGERLLRSLSFDEFGLEHTGQLGDVILGAYTQHDVPIDTPYKRYSNMLNVQIPESIKEQHDNMEQFLMYTRGFLGVLSTHMIRRHYTYAVSPFLDIEFLNTCFSLPLKIRRGGYIYWKWVDKKYPKAGLIPSTRKRPKGKTEAFVHRVTGKIGREGNKLLFAAGIKKSRTQSNDMNPIQYWFDTKDELQEFVESYYLNTKSSLAQYKTTCERVNKLMSSDRSTDKLIALTVLAVGKRYFGDAPNGEDNL